MGTGGNLGTGGNDTGRNLCTGGNDTGGNGTGGNSAAFIYNFNVSRFGDAW